MGIDHHARTHPHRLFAAQAGAMLIIPILINSTLVHLLAVAAVLLVKNFPSWAVFLVFLWTEALAGREGRPDFLVIANFRQTILIARALHFIKVRTNSTRFYRALLWNSDTPAPNIDIIVRAF